MRIEQLSNVTPEGLARALSELESFVWLDSARSSSPLSQWSLMSAAPTETLLIDQSGRVSLSGQELDLPPLEAIERFTKRPEMASGAVQGFPISEYVIGYVSYDFARLMSVADRVPASPDNKQIEGAAAAFGHYPSLILINHRDDQIWLVSTDADHAERLTSAINRFDTSTQTKSKGLDWKPAETRESFVRKIGRLKNYIADGDLYQANLAQRFTAELPDGFSPLSYYLGLREINAAPFAAYMQLGGRTILSASPERLISLDANGEVEARPIKGTARAPDDPLQCAQAAENLLSSEKDRAENIMIVDLLRNDLSRVCDPHTIKVSQLCALETYEGLHHLVSSIAGKLSSSASPIDLFEACFPGGSITGAPKQRAMEIIQELEGFDRGIFCGAIGYIGANGKLDFNIPIRTVEVTNTQAILHVGGGITHLSDADAEYEETLLKAEKIFALNTLFNEAPE